MSSAPAQPALEAVRSRRSWSKVTDAAPTRSELVTLLSAAGRVADHSSLRPWRAIELRGDDRLVLGAAIAEASGDSKPSTKPLRAPLVIAIVASYKKCDKVPRWEQEAVASGAAHTLSLLLDEAGWGVIWRTGGYTRSKAVAAAHGLGHNEELLGWLYVGGKPESSRPGRRKAVDARSHLTRMPGVTTLPDELGSSHDDDAERASAEKAAKKAAKKKRHAQKHQKKCAKKKQKKAEKPVDWAQKAKKAEKKARHADKKARKALGHAEKRAQKAQRARDRADAEQRGDVVA